MGVQRYEDLITSKEQTRAGFIAFALEKYRKSTPIVESAKSLRVLAASAMSPKELLNIPEIRSALLTASGLSDKSLKYFTEEDKNSAINSLIDNFLEPSGQYFVDEVVYRYLLTKGDALGGSMRNLVGAIAQQKLIRTLFSNLSVMGRSCYYLSCKSKNWHALPEKNLNIEEDVKAIFWENNKGKRVLSFNLKIPFVGNNIDICLFNSSLEDYSKEAAVKSLNDIIMLGELKGGIDPAGADEHWKTANSALGRIRKSFGSVDIPMKTSFVGAAIEKKMAMEIYAQLEANTLTYAANLTIDKQLVEYSNWVLNL